MLNGARMKATTLAEQLYGDCSKVLARTAQRAPRTRGGGMVPTDPQVWEAVLLTVHSLCVVHAVLETGVIKKLKELAGSWRRLGQRGGVGRTELRKAEEETTEILGKLERDLRDGVVKPLASQLDAAEEAIHHILMGFPPGAAQEIAETVAARLRETSSPATTVE